RRRAVPRCGGGPDRRGYRRRALLGCGAGVEGGRGAACAVCGILWCAISDRRRGPCFATRCREGLAFIAQRPGLFGEALLHRFAGFEMPGEAEKREVPADADRAGAEAVPEFLRFVVERGDMAEREARAVVAGLGQFDLDPADPAAEFPGQREALGRLARGDGAAGIALDLIFSAEAEVAFNRREPARDARLVGDRVPQIVDI